MILVAGGTGFLGQAIVRAILRQGGPAAVMSHRPQDASRHFIGLPVEVREGDARDPGSLARAVAGVDAVVSCMQFPNFPVENRARGETFEEVDARGNERLVAAAKTAGVQTFVYLSGAGAAPDAPYHWERSKWQAEEAIRSSGLRATILRPSWVYGPDDRSLNRFVGFARRLPFVPVIGNGKQRLQPVFVDDVARVTADSLRTDAASGRTLEIGGPSVMSMDEILHTMLSVMHKRKPLVHIPAALPKTAGRLFELLPLPRRPLSRDAVTFITMDAIADTTELQRVFPDLRLTPLAEGLETYLAPHAASRGSTSSQGTPS